MKKLLSIFVEGKKCTFTSPFLRFCYYKYSTIRCHFLPEMNVLLFSVRRVESLLSWYSFVGASILCAPMKFLVHSTCSTTSSTLTDLIAFLFSFSSCSVCCAFSYCNVYFSCLAVLNIILLPTILDSHQVQWLAFVILFLLCIELL